MGRAEGTQSPRPEAVGQASVTPRVWVALGVSDSRMVGFKGPSRILHCFLLPGPLKSYTLPGMGEGRGDCGPITKQPFGVNEASRRTLEGAGSWSILETLVEVAVGVFQNPDAPVLPCPNESRVSERE